MQEHAIIISGTSDPFVMQSSVQILSYNETPVRWCPILLENKVCSLSLKQKFHQTILQHSKVRFTVDGCSFKKKDPNTYFFDMAQNTFTLGESRTCSFIARGCLVPHMRVLCLLTLPVTWKVASSLNTRQSSNPSSSNITCIWVQKSSRADLSVSFKCWSKCSL